MLQTNQNRNTKKIVKNSLYLYVRMLVMMGVSLFTFRELLLLLGVDDYGTYNVVAGIVILFSFLSNAMTQSNQRFLSYYLGKNEKKEFQQTFSMIINVQVILAAVILLLAETVGLWFLNSKMNFAQENIVAVNWVYQFSIITFLFQILQIPFTSAIISHEKMNFFSYVSIGEALLRLLIVLLLGLFNSDRLTIYAGLLACSALVMLFINGCYSTSKFECCKYSFIWNRNLFFKLTSFSGWNMLGGLGNVGANQGINILFNIFCGVVVNAAMGVSHQIFAAVNSLVGNMQTAFNPQIVKSYASGDIDYFVSLIFRSSRISYILISVVGIPVIFCCNDILSIWLDEVPVYAVPFTQLTIVYCMIDALSGSLWTANQAHGKVRTYMIVVASLTLLNLPISYILLYKGLSPTWAMVTRAIITFMILNFRIIYIGKTIDFPYRDYYRRVVLKAILVILIVFPLSIFFTEIIHFSEFLQIFVQGGIIFVATSIVCYFIMLNSDEHNYIKKKLSRLILSFQK